MPLVTALHSTERCSPDEAHRQFNRIHFSTCKLTLSSCVNDYAQPVGEKVDLLL
jgi:hypothetical protein